MSYVKRDRICARSYVNRPMRPGLLSAPTKNLHMARFERQLETLVRTERILYISH